MTLPQIAGQQFEAAGMHERIAGQQPVIAGDDTSTAEAVDRVNRLTVDLALELFGLSGQPPRLVPLVAA